MTDSTRALDAIILAGGQGTRLRPVVADVPKPLAPVNGKPFLDIILTQLDRFPALRKVVLAIGYKAEQIQSHYRDARHFGFEIEFSIEQSPMGTGGALCQALALTRSDQILLLNGDSFVEFDLSKLMQIHARRRAAVTMVVVEVEDSGRYGSVTLDASQNEVLGFAEKTGRSQPGLINAGCYLLERTALSAFPSGPSSFERDILPKLAGSIFADVESGKFIDIGLPETYGQAADYLR